MADVVSSRSVISSPIQKVVGSGMVNATDALAVEEPLEIRLGVQGQRDAKRVSVTMRTPGNDAELAVGFLFTEGIVKSPDDVVSLAYIDKPIEGKLHQNVIRVDVNPSVNIDVKSLERNFYMTSSCGVCGKASIEAIRTGACPVFSKNSPRFDATTIHGMPETLRQAQRAFDQTGGLHAAALFNASGELIALREDVGRHNALDKLIGAAFVNGALPLDKFIVMVSGRASFELVQKALMAGVPALAAVGAPSSLAAELADDFDMTLLGFVRNNRFNIYAGAWRIHAQPLNGDACDLVTYREFTAADAQGVFETAHDSWKETYKNIFTPAMIEQMVRRDYSPDVLMGLLPKIASGEMFFRVALVNGRVVGFCNFGYCEKGMELRRIYLRPAYIGKGVGKNLLEAGERFARSKGNRAYFCFVHKDNEVGKRFYLKNGFTHCDNADIGDEWYMEKRLN